jgi:DNA-binding MarR family transcriptional regulator
VTWHYEQMVLLDVVGVEEAVRLRRAFTGINRQFNAAAMDKGLSPSEASVLGLVTKFGPLTMSGLAELEHVDAAVLSRVIADLSAKALVKEQAAADGTDPAGLVAATATGRRTHERIKTTRAALVVDRVAELPTGQRAALLQALPALERLAAWGKT